MALPAGSSLSQASIASDIVSLYPWPLSAAADPATWLSAPIDPLIHPYLHTHPIVTTCSLTYSLTAFRCHGPYHDGSHYIGLHTEIIQHDKHSRGVHSRPSSLQCFHRPQHHPQGTSPGPAIQFWMGQPWSVQPGKLIASPDVYPPAPVGGTKGQTAATDFLPSAMQKGPDRRQELHAWACFLFEPPTRP